eukprot:CAMPEP_0183326898 /NCGR_PEP_ID=MMETSP0160_2-20130417/83421_1 /TAXON_ID=2839 ORGANISM="Odontella Sinensis, Strain Grunow 1884" /NCGR_SAMPLE_ID=MMETSP0160_2 /ASSEMBLY_ACC=CAM_ASM_000250 /LENGTH=119 /DNA_ID=CAMNT_0025494993 /DNA_START=50 /DNA_END=406 /DNA_ORIENTATION=+
MEDWVEKMIFSPPVHVDNLARVLCAGALGCLGRDQVGNRKQGFYDTDGKPVLYDDVIFIDGTEAIEELSRKLATPKFLKEAVQIMIKNGEGSQGNDQKDVQSSEHHEKENPGAAAMSGH